MPRYIRDIATKTAIRIAIVQASQRVARSVILDVSRRTSPPYTATDAAV